MKAIATLLGVVLLALGLAGFVPDLNPDGQLFGVLPMTMVLSVLFVITGLAGIAIGMSSRRGLSPQRPVSDNDMRPRV
jgi:uncharacterized membrane protein YuzA (DUF378 family)